MIKRTREVGLKTLFSTLFIGFSALVMLTVWVPDSAAFSDFSGCADCHPVFGAGTADPEHNVHAAGAGNDCNSCHPGGAFNNPPIDINCTRCHGRVEDAGGDPISAGEGRGLRLHHQNGGFATCTPCHGDSNQGNPAAPESAMPVFYPGPNGLNACDGTEEQFPSNTVSLDNDGDLLTDGNDPDCAPPVENCTNGTDDDGDGLVDCADPDCSMAPACQPETDCNDGIDNDNDGLTDCADQDCASDPTCVTPNQETDCADGVDNDNDGMTDCADPDCSMDPACLPEREICDDGIDNDGDGLADCDDPDCAGAANCQPPTMENCTDGVDNDGDGMIDCDDQDCANDPACEQPVMEDCDDGIDNDSDGFIDCMDPDCDMDPACQNQETCPQFNPPADHAKRLEEDDCQAYHAPGYEKPFSNNCTTCHGSDLKGGIAPSCFTCHGEEWEEMDPGNGGGIGAPLRTPFGKCASCHTGFQGGPSGPLHMLHTNSFGATDCMICHGEKAPVCNYCHQVENHDFRKTERGDGHYLHAKELKLDCKTCHDPGRKDGSKKDKDKSDDDDHDRKRHRWGDSDDD